MNGYYHFDDENQRVVIERYDTPTPWMNYLSNGVFHTMISQAGGGVAFYKSPQIWRINHYRFFHLPTDRSGFYTYIKDGGAFWCPTSEPAREKPDHWQAVHGLGHTVFAASKNGVSVRAAYTVGPYANALIWNLKIKSDRDKRVTVFPFVELGMMEFMRELQWQCYNKHQLNVRFLEEEQALVYRYGVENQPKPDETPLVWFAADCPITGFDGDRDAFIGGYRSEENPIAVETGRCAHSTMAGGDPCFALQIDLDLEAGAERELNVFLGTAMTGGEIAEAVQSCRTPGFFDRSLAAVKESHARRLDKFTCDIPDEHARRMINIWNPYQAGINFMLSRNISYYATGTFRGVGFRDTAQDILAVIPLDPEAATAKTLQLLGQQYADGHVNHYFFPHEGWDPVTTIHSDDHLWIVLTVHQLIMESGSSAFLSESVPYYDGGGGTVYEHLERSIEFSMVHIGKHGFPLMLHSDWNDALFRVCRAGKGESIWTAMQLGLACTKMAELAELAGKNGDPYRELFDRMRTLVNTLGWDGEWYRRAITDDGRYLGSATESHAKIWLNAQTWPVMAGMAEPDKAVAAMNSVKKHLDTPLGIKKIHPSMVDYPSKADPLTNYNPGTSENGSVFCHANTWAVIAECLLGRGEQAYEYYRKLIPAVAFEAAGAARYRAEPYVYASNLFGPESDKFGLANVSWLTGTAAWMYVAATQYILGVRAVWDGLLIDPCIPASWNSLYIEREFRGCRYRIAIDNAAGVSHGVKSVTLDAVPVDGRVVMSRGKTANVTVVMGDREAG